MFKNYPIITSPRYFFRNNFHPESLFSEQIFGPVDDYKCQCGKYSGKEYSGIVCEKCGVLITSSKLRSETYARIEVPETTVLFNPLIIDLIENFKIPHPEKFKISKCITGETRWIVDNGVLIKSNEKDAPQGPVYFYNEILPILLENIEFKKIYEKYEKYLYVKNIPVIPPDARPITLGSGSQYFVDDLNKKYNIIIRSISYMNKSPFVFEKTQSYIQKQYNDLVKSLLEKFEHRNGFLRSHVLGKRTDYSGRAVIGVDGGDMPLGECKLPFEIAKNIFKPQVIKPLAKKLKKSPLFILKDYDTKNMKPYILEILKEKFINEYIILNRQPSLHKPSMQSCKINDIIEDDIIVIHPLVTSAYNADFDGDQMAVYVPQGIAKKEAIEKLSIHANKRLPSNGEVMFNLNQDMILGLHKLTDGINKKMILYMGEETIEDRITLFKDVFEKKYQNVEMFKIFNKTFNKSSIKEFIDISEEIMESDDWIHMIDKLSRIGFKNSHISITLDDFLPENKESNNAKLMVESGARGSWNTYIQIAEKKGYVTDISGNILPHEIENNFINGLSEKDFFISAYGGRKGLIDSAGNTAKSGYMTRKLVYLLAPLLIDKDIADCYKELKNEKYFILNIRDEAVAKSLIGRYTDQFKITKGNYKSLVNKTIKLKSPITCKAPGICQICYGDLYKKHKSKMIGIIAAQSCGERTTQLTLRTKHVSGAVEKNEFLLESENFLKYDDGKLIALVPGSYIIYDEFISFNYESDIEIILNDYIEFIPFINFDKDTEIHFNTGDIIADVKFENNDIVSAVNILSSIFSNPNAETIEECLYQVLDVYGNYANIDLIHFELILSLLARSIDDVNIPYRYSDSYAFNWLGLMKVIALIPEQALAFERFSFHLKKFLNDDTCNDLLNDKFSLLKSMLFMDFPEYVPKDGDS